MSNGLRCYDWNIFWRTRNPLGILCDNIEKDLTDEHQEAADDNEHITLKLSKDEHVAVLRYEYIEVISSSEGFPEEVIALLKEHADDQKKED